MAPNQTKPNQTKPSVKPHSALMMSQNLISHPSSDHRPSVRPIVRPSPLLEGNPTGLLIENQNLQNNLELSACQTTQKQRDFSAYKEEEFVSPVYPVLLPRSGLCLKAAVVPTSGHTVDRLELTTPVCQFCYENQIYAMDIQDSQTELFTNLFF